MISGQKIYSLMSKSLAKNGINSSATDYNHRDGRLRRIQREEKFSRPWDAVEVVDEDDGIEQPL